MESYFEQLNQIYSNDEIKNVAITGTYGAGKSTVWKSYVNLKQKDEPKNWKKELLLNVSLADFNNPYSEIKYEGKKNEYEQRSNHIEKQITNQILYQIDSKKIRLSQFFVKRTGGGVNWSLIAFLLSVGTGVFLAIINEKLINNLNISDTKVGLSIEILPYILIILPILVFLYWSLPKIMYKITKINLKGAEAQINEDSEGILDRAMHEVVYLIISSGAHTIVFEDLDRFEDMNLFIRLRELNILVNKRSKETVKFIYMIKDSMFLSKDRTKFFDIIVPVVPHVNSQNSKGKLLELFSDIKGTYSCPDINVLERTALFLDEMRTIYSIRNEYEIYFNVIDLERRELNPNKLFGLIVFKNIYPQHFDDLQLDKGYVFDLFKDVEEYRDRLELDVEDKIDDCKTQINYLENMVAENTVELLSLETTQENARGMTNNGKIKDFIEQWSRNPDKTYNAYFERLWKQYSYKEYLSQMLKDETFEKRYDALGTKTKNKKVILLNNELEELFIQKEEIELMNTSEILNSLDSKELKVIFRNLKYNDLVNSHYFDLIKFLILEELIDKTYIFYRGPFIKNSLDIADETYLRKLRLGEKIKPDFQISKPAIIIDKLDKKDLSRPSIFNHILLDKMIEVKSIEKLQKSVDTILKSHETTEDLFRYLDILKSEELCRFIKIMLPEGFDNIIKILYSNTIYKNMNDRLAGGTLILLNKNGKTDFEINKLVSYINENSQLLEVDVFNENEKLVSVMIQQNVKFKNFINTDISVFYAKSILESSLYKLTFDNTIYLLEILLTKNKDEIIRNYFSLIMNEELSSVKDYIFSEINSIIDSYIKIVETEDLLGENSEKDTLILINSDIENSNKEGFISINRTKITSFVDVNDQNLWESLIFNDRIEFNEKNIHDLIDNEIDERVIIEYLNSYYNNSEPQKLPEGMKDKLINNSAITDNVFNSILNGVTIKIDNLDNDLEKDRIKKLINENKIEINQFNLLIILEKGISGDDLINFLSNDLETSSLLINDPEIINELPKELVIKIINSKIFSNEIYIEFINNINYELSIYDVSDINVSLQDYIIKNKWDTKDIGDIIKTPEKFSTLGQFFQRLSSDDKLLDLE